MDREHFIIATFCLVDDLMVDILGHRRLRQRGPAPKLADSEVLTMEIVGEYLSLHQDKAIFDYFRRHYLHFFPALRPLHRTTFVRQAANPCHLKERIWQRLLPRMGCEPWLQLVDSFPLPVCQFARAHRCRCFGGEAAFGYDVLLRQTFYGFRVHVLVAWPGVIVRFSLAPANVHETTVVPELVDGRQGIVVGDRNYWSPLLREALAPQGVPRQAPYQKARQDPWPRRSANLSRLRYRIDTVFGPLVDRYLIKRVRTRDLWHPGHRLLRKVLSHTLAFLLNQGRDHPPLQLSKLVT